MPERPDAATLARRLADALDAENLPYAIGGALALGHYTPPRGTVDVDLNVFIAVPEEIDRLLACLQGCGFEPDAPSAVERTAMEDGQFRGRIRGTRVDVFVPANDVYASLERGRRKVSFAGRPGWIVGPEDLATLKMLFFRRKDLADVEALVRAQGGGFDRAAVRARLVELVGDEDERVREWDSIVSDCEDGASRGPGQVQ